MVIEERGPSGSAHIMPRGTVLVVDDSVELVRGLTTLLSNDGYKVVSVSSGAGAIEAVAMHRPDLVVLDVMMPIVDGWEVLKRIRENPATERLAVMMLTAKGTEDAKVKGFSLGADDYLAKPFSVREFRCRVEALFRRISPPRDENERSRIPVIAEAGTEFIETDDIFYIEGIRNYTYVHTFHARFLGRQSLGAIEARELPGLVRVHRSYIVRLDGVKGYRWASRSSFRLVLGDAEETPIPVSRALVTEIKQLLDR